MEGSQIQFVSPGAMGSPVQEEIGTSDVIQL